LRIFLSYNFKDEAFVREVVQRVGYYLRKQKEVEVYLWSEGARAGRWTEQVKAQLKNCQAGVVFISGTIGETQKQEISALDGLEKRISLSRGSLTTSAASSVRAARPTPAHTA
jgi:hypothetical protein